MDSGHSAGQLCPHGCKHFQQVELVYAAGRATAAQPIPPSLLIYLLPRPICTSAPGAGGDVSCEYLCKPSTTLRGNVHSIAGSLYNPANLNEPCQIQWILINLRTEILRETKLQLCNYAITRGSRLPLPTQDFDRLLKEEQLKRDKIVPSITSQKPH